MIIDPDFLDHWRTRMLVDALQGDEQAPLYLIRIWGHCQSRRAASFEMPSDGLKALCRYVGNAADLEAALISTGFITRDSNIVNVLKWAEKNIKLVTNWSNGVKGGKPKQNPKRTRSKPKANPVVTQPNPTVTQPEPIREDKIRLEKSRKEKIPASPPATQETKIPLEQTEGGECERGEIRPRDLLFESVAVACGIDWHVCSNDMRGMLNQTCGVFRKEGLTAEQVQFVAVRWYEVDWRGQKGQPPTPAQLREFWGRAYQDVPIGVEAKNRALIDRLSEKERLSEQRRPN